MDAQNLESVEAAPQVLVDMKSKKSDVYDEIFGDLCYKGSMLYLELLEKHDKQPNKLLPLSINLRSMVDFVVDNPNRKALHEEAIEKVKEWSEQILENLKEPILRQELCEQLIDVYGYMNEIGDALKFNATREQSSWSPVYGKALEWIKGLLNDVLDVHYQHDLDRLPSEEASTEYHMAYFLNVLRESYESGDAKSADFYLSLISTANHSHRAHVFAGTLSLFCISRNMDNSERLKCIGDRVDVVYPDGVKSRQAKKWRKFINRKLRAGLSYFFTTTARAFRDGTLPLCKAYGRAAAV